MTISAKTWETLNKHSEDTKSLHSDRIGNFLDFMSEEKLWRENIPSIINTTVMTASLAKLVGLTKNGWLKTLGAGIVGGVNFIVLYEKYKDEFNAFVLNRQKVVNEYWFDKLEDGEVVSVVEEGLKLLGILKAENASCQKLEAHWLAIEKESPLDWEEFHVTHFWGMVEELNKHLKV